MKERFNGSALRNVLRLWCLLESSWSSVGNKDNKPILLFSFHWHQEKCQPFLCCCDKEPYLWWQTEPSIIKKIHPKNNFVSKVNKKYIYWRQISISLPFESLDLFSNALQTNLMHLDIVKLQLLETKNHPVCWMSRQHCGVFQFLLIL